LLKWRSHVGGRRKVHFQLGGDEEDSEDSEDDNMTLSADKALEIDGI
jgi:hypothetical protein